MSQAQGQSGSTIIGIFGGTFDPVHIGHLRTAIELRESLGLDKCTLLPCHKPTHRGQPGATTDQRIAMLREATAGVDQLEVDSREALRDKPSYSVDTLSSFREELPDARLVFCMGMDAFDGFTRWHRWQEILNLAHLLVVSRPGSSVSGPAAELLAERQVANAGLFKGQSGSILMQSLTQIEISATRIRELVSQNRDINYLVPETVRRYIHNNGLYRE